MPEQENIERIAEKISWQTQEYEFVHKTSEWYWVVGIIAAGIAIASLFFGNILFAVLIIVAAFTVMLFGARPPQTVHCELTNQGLKLNNEFHSFKSLESFWIYLQTPASIIFKSKKMLSPYIIIPLEYLNPDNTRAFILKHLPEEEHQIPFAELLSRRLGF
ncbi:MAG: hypothetical protein WC764_02585 [Candidatus Paceibacterota bacterium]|jgi:hypothetical protein